ncbi:hypothetical protein GCM10027456_32390 [Kineosporia babensis]
MIRPIVQAARAIQVRPHPRRGLRLRIRRRPEIQLRQLPPGRLLDPLPQPLPLVPHPGLHRVDLADRLPHGAFQPVRVQSADHVDVQGDHVRAVVVQLLAEPHAGLRRGQRERGGIGEGAVLGHSDMLGNRGKPE